MAKGALRCQSNQNNPSFTHYNVGLVKASLQNNHSMPSPHGFQKQCLTRDSVPFCNNGNDNKSGDLILHTKDTLLIPTRNEFCQIKYVCFFILFFFIFMKHTNVQTKNKLTKMKINVILFIVCVILI